MRKASLIFVLLMLGLSAPAYSLPSMGDMRDAVSRVAEGLGLVSESNERCHTEEVRSRNISDPVLSGECHRVICGPNFWGKSALDLCCEEEPVVDGEITYKRCHMRHPKEVYSPEVWNEVKIQTGGPTGGCGNWRQMFDEEGDGTYGQLDLPDPIEFLIPSAFAVTDDSPTADQWDEARRSDFSAYFQELANRISEAIEVGDVRQVGEPGSEFRMYVEDTLDAVSFFAFIVDPTETTTCPGGWGPLCDLLSPPTVNPGNHFFPRWSVPSCRGLPAGVLCTGAQVNSLNMIEFNQDLRITDRETLSRGFVMIDGAHEMGHILYHWVNGMYNNPVFFDAIPIRYNRLSRYPVINYENEATAQLIGAIAQHFLTDRQQSDLLLFIERSGQFGRTHSRGELIFQYLQNGSASLARLSMYENYLFQFFFDSLSIVQQEEFYAECPVCSSSPTGDTCVDCVAQTFTQSLSRLGITLQTLEDDLYMMGGPFGLSGVSPYAAGDNGLSARAATVHPHVAHNFAVSPDTGGPVGTTGDAAEAPPEDYNWDDPDNIGGEANSDAWSGDEEQLRACITDFYYNQIHTGTAGETVIPAECYQYCWNRSFELCEPLRVNDLDNNCSLSNLDLNCEAALRERRLTECATNPGASFCDGLCQEESASGAGVIPEFCRPICESTGGQGYCAAYCNDFPSMSICNTRCRGDRGREYCGGTCETYYPSESYCTDLCFDRPGHSYCGEICVRDHGEQGFCTERCTSSDVDAVYCSESCQRWRDRGSVLPDWCHDLCERRGGCGWERSERPEPEEEEVETASGGGGGSAGCPGGETPYDELLLGYEWDGCYPFVGPAECCGSVSNSNCNPVGLNRACEDGGFRGYCGWPMDGSEVWDCCRLPDLEIPGYFQIQYLGSDRFAYQEWLVPAVCSFGCISFYGQGNEGFDNYIDDNCTGR